MMVLLAIAFVVLHAVLILLAPVHVMVMSYAFLVAVPLLASAAAVRRGLIAGFGLTQGWSLAAISFLLWTLGMISSLRQDLFLANGNLAPRETMLPYVLFGVPIFYVVATVGAGIRSPMQRGIDAALTLMLGGLYFLLMFSLTSRYGTSDPASARLVADMFDLENIFLAVTTALRFFAADTIPNRHLFGTLAAFTCSYAAVAAYYNHHVAMDLGLSIGNRYDPIVDVPFLLFATLAWQGPTRLSRSLNPAIGLVRFIRSGSPLLLTLTVLVVALPLLHWHFAWAVAGIVTAVLGYGLRTILSQVHQIETEDELRHDRSMFAELAMRDGLTEVPNRRAFEEALEREWRLALRTKQPVSLLLVDIDLFKQYNDRYGHLAGDDCLRSVAGVLQHALRRPSDLLARYGGEEFVLILPNTPGAGAREVATRLCRQVRQLELSHDDSPTRYLTISIGVASFVPIDGAQPEQLISSADGALYAAKRNGRNRAEWAA
jgi:diguanylate cyclase (GGDEF)-like protein